MASPHDSADFSTSSFSATASGLSGGTPSMPGPGVLYSYSITGPTGSSAYAANGNVGGFNDSILGQWSFTYDNLNRMISGNASSGLYANMALSWGYDPFGNRLGQAAAPTGPQPPQTTQAYTYTGSTSNRPDQLLASFDAAGNLGNDGLNSYLYDAEGRICAVQAGGQFGGAMTGYLYNAEGVRIAKGTLTSFSCDPAVNGFSVTAAYVLGPNGEQMSELDAAGDWRHTNVFARGKLLATYDPLGTHFALTDWLGTKRVQVSGQGVPEEQCSSLPFGDSLSCTLAQSASDASEHHFTGKERDAESGLDYFGARELSSNMGRWMSPDPSILFLTYV